MKKKSMKFNSVSEKSEFSFKCDICAKTFSVKRFLTNHFESQHLQNVIECSICEKQYFSKIGLKVHEKSHTQTQDCDICQKQFRNKSELKIHKARHSGEMLFECTTCGTGFASKTEFEEHIRIHTGENPFKY